MTFLRFLCALLFSLGAGLSSAGVVSTSSAFIPAQIGRTWMDVGGVFNGTTNIAPANGDTFDFVLSNAASTSFDLKASVTLPTDFTLITTGANSPTIVSTGCAPAPVLGTATLALNVLTFSLTSTGAVSSGYDMGVGCSITLRYKGFSTVAASPGTNIHLLNFTTAATDAGVAVAGTAQSQSVQVNFGASVLEKLPSNQLRAVGSTALWTSPTGGISVSNTGLGGLFNVTINETAINPGGSLALTSLLSSSTTCAAGLCTLAYLPPAAVLRADAQATVTGCTAIGNTVATTDITGATSKTKFAQVTLDLKQPAIDFTPPAVTMNYVGNTAVSFSINNTLGLGPARNLTLQTSFPTSGLTVSNVGAGWTYNAGSGVFTYTALNLAAGASASLSFDLSTNVCTYAASPLIQMTPSYTDDCGASFVVPTRLMSIAPPAAAPTVSAAKTANSTRINMGQAGSYSIVLNASSVGQIAGTNIIATDTLPAGITGVSLSATGGSFTCSGGCTGGSLVVWTVDKNTLPRTLTINYNAPSSVCLAGTNLTNNVLTQAVTTAGCSINGNSSATQLMTNVLGATFSQDYNVSPPTGAFFETGTRDLNNNGIRDNQEGEFVPVVARYSFGAAYPGVWSGAPNTTYGDDFTQFNNTYLVTGGTSGINVRLANTFGGALGAFIPVPSTSITCAAGTVGANDCRGGFTIDFAFLAGAGFYSSNNVENKELEISYRMVFPDSAVPAAGTANRTTLARLVISGGSGGCLGGTFTQGDFIALARARPTVAIAMSQVMDVCQNINATMSAANANEENTRNLLLSILNSPGLYQIPATPSTTFTGVFTSLGTWNYNAGANPTVSMPANSSLTAAGGVVFPVFLGALASTTPAALTVRADFDDLQTSDTAAPDFINATGVTGSGTPQIVRKANLAITVTPQQITVSGRTVTWRVYVTNVGNGVATNVNVTQTLPDGLLLDASATNAINAPLVAGGSLGSPTFLISTLNPGETRIIDIVVRLTGSQCSILSSPPYLNTNWGCGAPFVAAQSIQSSMPGFILPTGQLQVTSDSSQTICSLCGTASHVVRVRNTGAASVYNISLKEVINTPTSGLTLASVEFSTNGGSTWNPIVGLPAGTGVTLDPYVLTATHIATLAELVPLPQANATQFGDILVRYNMSTSDTSNAASHALSASTDATTACGAVVSSGLQTYNMPVRRPIITVTKSGFNRTSAPITPVTGGTFISTVVGGAGDEVIWRIRVTNSGPVDALNLSLTDIFAGSGATTMSLCNTAGGCANDFATPVSVSSNVSLTLPNLTAGSTRDLYLREMVGAVCLSGANNIARINWGCTSTSTLATPTTNQGTASLITAPNFTASSMVVTPLPNGRARIDYSVTNSGGNSVAPTITANLPVNYAALDTTTMGAPAATLTVAGLIPASITGLTRSGPATAPVWTINGVFRGGQSITLTYYVLPITAPGVPFADTVAATSNSQLTVSETVAAGLDPAAPTSQGFNMVIAAAGACIASNTAAGFLDFAMPDLDIVLTGAAAPAYLVTTTSIGTIWPFAFQIINNGEAGSTATTATFTVPITGTAWDGAAAAVSVLSLGGGATQSSFNCVASGSDRVCTFAGIIPAGGQINLNVALTLQNTSLPLGFSPTIASPIVAQDNSTVWSNHSFDRIAYNLIGAVLQKTLTASTNPDTLNTNLVVGEEAIFDNSLFVFGAGANPVTGIILRDNLSNTIGTDNYFGLVNYSLPFGVTQTGTTTPAVVAHGFLNLVYDNITTGSGTRSFILTARVLNGPAVAVGGSASTNNLGVSFDYLGSNFKSNNLNDTFAVNGTRPSLHAQAVATVRKPVPTFTKEARNFTQNGPWTSAANANIGDVVHFRMVVTNPAASLVPMYDLQISDDVGTRLALIPLATDGLDNDGDGIGTEGNIAGTVVSFDATNASNPKFLNLPSGQSLTVTFATTQTVLVTGGELVTNTAVFKWSSLPGINAPDYGGQQTVSPGAPSTLTGEFTQTLSATAFASFNRLGGRVYIDANHSSSIDASETLGAPYTSTSPPGPQLYAKLVLGGVFYAQVPVAANGSFAFGTLPAGNWQVIINSDPLNSNITPQLPPGYVGTQNGGFSVGFVTTAANVLMPSLQFGIYRGSLVRGTVILDNGRGSAGGGVAHDAVLNGSEIGLPGVRVCASTGTTCTGVISATEVDTALTDSAGNFALYIPANAGAVNIIEKNLTGYISVNGNKGTLPPASSNYSLATDSFSLSVPWVTGTTYNNLVFADVLSNTLSPDNARGTQPGNVVYLPHRFIAQSTGNVGFSVTSAISSPAGLGFQETIYRDLDCDGQISPTELVITAPISMRAANANTTPALTNPAVGNPSLVCIVVRQFVPANAGVGARRTLVVQASFDYAGAIAPVTLTVADLTTVGGGATGLELVKTVDITQAAAGATLTYTITFTNHSAQPITNLVINDATPPYTGFLSAALSAISPASLGTCTKFSPVFVAAGQACALTTSENPAGQSSGGVRWQFSGTLDPGASGAVSFRVRVNP
jgi:uncharacterized repeat protein (TIGR01451 family)/fimbrial isopeptide formation D2 family protein